MQLSDLIAPDAVLCDVRANSKKQFLQTIAEHAAPGVGVTVRSIFDTLSQRERLGSTGIGNGVAIPHGKLADIEGIHAYFMRLAKPLPFEAMDDEPVDLVFLLLAPEESGADHLKALARVARVMREPQMLDLLRAAPDARAVHALLSQVRGNRRRPDSGRLAVRHRRAGGGQHVMNGVPRFARRHGIAPGWRDQIA